jgi:hypothetical protein
MAMQPVAYAAQAPIAGAWSVSREGTPVASVVVAEEGGSVVVSATISGKKQGNRDPYRFDSLETADAFVRDLLASFTYLGCVIATAE